MLSTFWEKIVVADNKMVMVRKTFFISVNKSRKSAVKGCLHFCFLISITLSGNYFAPLFFAETDFTMVAPFIGLPSFIFANEYA